MIDNIRKFFNEREVTGGSILRNQRTSSFYRLCHTFLIDFGFYFIPTDNGIRNIVPVFFRKYKHFAICNCLYVFRGHYLGAKFLVVYNEIVIINEVIGDLFSFVVVITKAKYTFQNKSDLPRDFSCFGKITILLKIKSCCFARDEVSLVFVQIAKL